MLFLHDDDPRSPFTQPFVDPMPIPPTAMTSAFGGLDPTRADCTPFLADPNKKMFRLLEEAVDVSLHSGLPPTPIWRYRDVNTPASSGAAAGPTFKIFMNEAPLRTQPGVMAGPVIVRFENHLPPNHMGFGCPCSTVHFHGGHVSAASDGFPENITNPFLPTRVVFAPVGIVPCPPPEGIDEPVAGCDVGAADHYDYCYPMRDVGFTHGQPAVPERASANWYHDHLFDFTATNVYRGLAGMYWVFDEFDADDETGTRFPATNLRFPSGVYDVPLILQDKRLAIEGNRAHLVYNSFDHRGFLGDKYLVNGKIQPFFDVERRKYRFRILNASNSRFYSLFLEKNGSPQTFTTIGAHGNLFNFSIAGDTNAFVESAERHQIIVDFSRFQTGDRLYLVNRLRQDDGRGPRGTFERPELLDPGVQLLEFRVGGLPAVADTSRDTFDLRGTARELVAISAQEQRNARRRTFLFDRRRGSWTINNTLADLERVSAEPRLNQGEIWRLQNGGGGWWHPVHIHVEFMRVLTRNGRTPELSERDGFNKEDTVVLGPNDQLEVFFKFRDFPGPFVMHCHNLEHEDMRMMARFDLRA